MNHDFDLITIGAGSGGVAASRRAALHGAKVAIVESGRVGGTCVLRGCVPKKLLMYAASYGDAAHDAAGYGWQWPAGAAPTFDMARWQAAKRAETARLESAYRDLLAQGKVELIEGFGRIAGAHSVEVNGRRLSARHILIATGGAPVRDSIAGIESCATSDDLLDLTELPDRAAVVGGGYIAVEFASMLSRLGVQVTMLFRDRLPLRGFDEDLRLRLARNLGDAAIELRPGQAPRQIAHHGPGWRLWLPDGSQIDRPWVLNATGRRPNTAGLGLETIGLTTDAGHALAVDARLQTAVDHVHAIGDVTNRRHLTPLAIAEGRVLADRLFGGAAGIPVNLNRIATGVFTLPPIGSIGPTEAELASTGRTLRIYEADFRPMRHAFTGRPQRCYMKLLVDDASDTVLAVHMIGDDAPEIVQSLAVALTAGATKTHFDATLAVHPTVAEEFVLMRTPARRVN